MMKYIKVDIKLPVLRFRDLFIATKTTSRETNLSFLKYNDFSSIRNLHIEEEMFLVSIFSSYAILYHFSHPEYFYEYEIEKGILEKINSYTVREYCWSNGLILTLDRLNNQFNLNDSNNNFIKQIQTESGLGYRWCNSGILKVKRFKKENNWIECLNLIDNTAKWHVDFQWEIVRIEIFQNLIVLEYHAYDNIRTDKGYEGEGDWYNPNRYTIVLDSETGKERWSYPNSYHHIDFENGVILTGWAKQSVEGEIKPSRVIELDIYSGVVLTDEIVKPAIEGGRYYCFVDDEGIYYKTHEGAFGKINKSDGLILWEFDLQDAKGEKRKLSDWLLLGNGNLVLQAAPNHPNGDLTCIFNPQENMELSNVKNGIRKI